ncbi:MAG TPA: glycosyltransferase family 2 protein [Pirellulales bacterium]|jgi:undecaprenyl-phosphate 4-deoxy-4-formamido-L-arabinose transferase|nr:glycosyltransferase family 2 protein [Pirellulales bacterium]
MLDWQTQPVVSGSAALVAADGFAANDGTNSLADGEPLQIDASGEATHEPSVELSLIVPVFNASATLVPLVDEIHHVFAGRSFEVVLVNDGSADDTQQVCQRLAQNYPTTVTAIELSRNFGEQHAVMAGLQQSAGRYVAVLDDDGQNPPQEADRMLQALRANNWDVVYGRYRERAHPWPRRLGSWFNDVMANVMLGKPRRLYLSSFKVMNRFLVDELTWCSGPFLYLDGLILRITRRIGQVDVLHLPRQAGRSGYTVAKLFNLWLNMFLGFSTLPLRGAMMLGLLTACVSAVILADIVVERWWLDAPLLLGIPMIIACVAFFAGVQLVMLGMIGEYVGRMFQHQNGRPPFVVRSALVPRQTLPRPRPRG